MSQIVKASIMMSGFMVLIFLLLIMRFTLRNRIHISQMAGMLVAMTMGMMVGLIAGTAAGVIFKGDIFVSTVLGLLTGMTAGFLSGVWIGVMAVIDGMLSGLMGGMMGAMLGEMLPPHRYVLIFKLMVLLFSGNILILFYMLRQQIPPYKKHGSWFENSIFAVTLMFILFTGYNVIVHRIPFTAVQQQDSPLFQAVSQVEITAREFMIQPGHINIDAHQPVTLIVQNRGRFDHNFKIMGVHARFHDLQDRSVIDKGLYTIAGTEKRFTLAPLKPGLYEFVCTIPGHREAGMYGVIKVS
ncbi:MAG: cupredoxin domain-containing protein [Bacillaceae bacterium]|nr:cupredoxin domain-containing protein [Bacillaceae bacterium]